MNYRQVIVTEEESRRMNDKKKSARKRDRNSAPLMNTGFVGLTLK